MTSTNIDAHEQPVAAFKGLPVDDQLAALALIYTEVSGSITSATLKRTSPEASREIVSQIKHMSAQEQLLAMRDLLLAGGSSPLTLEYASLDTNSRLAVWYQLAQGLGDAIVSIPRDHSISSETAEFLDLLKSMDFEHLVSFLSSVV